MNIQHFVMFHEKKKVADTIKSQIAELLSMGRSLGIIVIIGLQRADSELFKLGARDNFSRYFRNGEFK